MIVLAYIGAGIGIGYFLRMFIDDYTIDEGDE